MLSVEVIVGGLTDCKSIIWTWLVGSGDTSSPFRECSKYLLTQNKNSTTCLVMCSCVTPYAKLYFKHNVIQFDKQQRYNVCEIILRPGNIKAKAKYGYQLPWNTKHMKQRLYLRLISPMSLICHMESLYFRIYLTQSQLSSIKMMTVYGLIKTRFVLAKQTQAWHIKNIQSEVRWIYKKKVIGDIKLKNS